MPTKKLKKFIFFYLNKNSYDKMSATLTYPQYRSMLREQKITYESGMWAEYQAKNGISKDKKKPATDAKGSVEIYRVYQHMASKKVAKIPNDPATGKPYKWLKIKEGAQNGDPEMKKLYKKVEREYKKETCIDGDCD